MNELAQLRATLRAQVRQSRWLRRAAIALLLVDVALIAATRLSGCAGLVH